MKKEIIKRVEEVSDYILETKKTIRETAKKYKISKNAEITIEVNPRYSR